MTETNPVLKICFGPPTAESKNLKNHVNFDVGDLFFRSPALWSSQNVFGPPTAGRVVVDFKDRVEGGHLVKHAKGPLLRIQTPHLRQVMPFVLFLFIVTTDANKMGKYTFFVYILDIVLKAKLFCSFYITSLNFLFV